MPPLPPGSRRFTFVASSPFTNAASAPLHYRRHRATMVASILTWAKTLLMRVKYLMMMWCGFVGRGMNGECDQVKRREALELEEFSWLDLPTDVFKLILSKLRYEDEAKLECVCKTWRDIIKRSLPVYPVGKSPLLIHVKSRGGGGGEKGAIFHYYSPLLNRAFQLGFPLDFRGYEIISAIDGTLLIYNQNEMQMRMVDPLSGYTINIKSITRNISFNGTAIGLRANCYVIFLIDTSHENQVTVHLCQRGGWALDMVYDNGNEPFYLSSSPVYFDGRFYCLGSKGDRLGVFDLFERTWDLYSVEFITKYDDDDIHCCCYYYLVAWIDTVMAVRVKNYGSKCSHPVSKKKKKNYGSGIDLFLLDRRKMVWKETDDLCGRSLFLGSTLSAMSLPTAKKLQNRVFLPHCHQDQPKAVTVAKPVFWPDLFYFMTTSKISIRERNHAATTICCCNNSGKESLYLGSTQNQKYCTIWYQPFYTGLTDD